MKEHEKVYPFDRERIEQALADFEAELNKVSGPIVEKGESVTQRVVDPAQGNPSDQRNKAPSGQTNASKNF